MGNLQTTRHSNSSDLLSHVADPRLALLSVFTFSISPYCSPVRQMVFIYRWGNWGSVASDKQEQSWPLKSVLLDCLAYAGVQASSAHTGKGCWEMRIQHEGISLPLSHIGEDGRIITWHAVLNSKCLKASWVRVLFFPLLCLWVAICFSFVSLDLMFPFPQLHQENLFSLAAGTSTSYSSGPAMVLGACSGLLLSNPMWNIIICVWKDPIFSFEHS